MIKNKVLSKLKGKWIERYMGQSLEDNFVLNLTSDGDEPMDNVFNHPNRDVGDDDLDWDDFDNEDEDLFVIATDISTMKLLLEDEGYTVTEPQETETLTVDDFNDRQLF